MLLNRLKAAFCASALAAAALCGHAEAGSRIKDIVNIEGVPIEADITEHMLFIRNEDKPGMIGGLGTILAQNGHNIADFRLGRVEAGKTAVALVSLDKALPDDVYEKIAALPQINQVKRLKF